MLKFSSKFLEKKDIIDIAIIHKVFTKAELLDLIMLIFDKKETEEENERRFPIALYKIFILYEDFEIFQYLLSFETCMLKEDLLSMCKYSIMCSSSLFTIYFGKAYDEQLSKMGYDIITELINYLETANSKLIYTELLESILELGHIENIEGKALHQFEEKLYFIESLIDYFTFKHAKTFENIILQFVEVASKEHVF
jgi:hypothetical protein